MKEYSLWLFENRVIENSWTKERESNRTLGENLVMRRFIICVVSQILLGRSNINERDRCVIQHAWKKSQMHTELWSGALKEIDHLEDLCVNWRAMLK